jgi:glycosyltransferase involved in cell wall biosynthesis
MLTSPDHPLVSIIIPCFNGERYLAQTLESVLWQTSTRWECILVDDGSTDGSKKIFEKYQTSDARFRYLYQTNSGAAAARNNGIRTAQGTYVQLLDADDILMPQKLEISVAQFRKGPAIDVVYTDYVIYDRYRGFWHSISGKIPEDDVFRALLFENNITFAALLHAFLFKREIISRHMFNTELNCYGEDVECWIRMAADGVSFSYVDSKMIIYRMSENSLSKNEIHILQAKLQVLHTYRDIALVRGYLREYRDAEGYLFEKLAVNYFREHRFKNGWNLIRSNKNILRIQSIIRLCFWFILLSILSWTTLERLRTFLFQKTFIRWGGWTHYESWQPTDEIVRLMKHS